MTIFFLFLRYKKLGNFVLEKLSQTFDFTYFGISKKGFYYI